MLGCNYMKIHIVQEYRYGIQTRTRTRTFWLEYGSTEYSPPLRGPYCTRTRTKYQYSKP